MTFEPMRPVLICTEYKGVFFGYANDTSGDAVNLKRAKMAIYWNTTGGVAELANVGPNDGSKVGSEADVELRKVSAVFEVTKQAEEAWSRY